MLRRDEKVQKSVDSWLRDCYLEDCTKDMLMTYAKLPQSFAEYPGTMNQ